MESFANLLAWANEHRVRLSLRFIPDQAPSVFVLEGQVSRPEAGKHMYEFVRCRGKTLKEVSTKFLERVNNA